MSVSATTLSRLVKMFSATTAMISTICPSLETGVADRLECQPSADMPALAHDLRREPARLTSALTSPEAPLRFSLTSSGLIFARFSPR